MNNKLEINLEVGLWYRDIKSKSDFARKCLYKCVYVDSDIAVVQQYFEGKKHSSSNTTPVSKRFQLSETNDKKELLNHYQNEKEKSITIIADSIIRIKNEISMHQDYDKCIDFLISKNPELSKPQDTLKSELEYLVRDDLEEIKYFFLNS